MWAGDVAAMPGDTPRRMLGEVDQLLERNPDVDPKLVEDLYCGCGMPQGLQAFNVARVIVMLSEQLTQLRSVGDILQGAIETVSSLIDAAAVVFHVRDEHTGDFWPRTEDPAWSGAARRLGASCARG